MDFQTAEWTSNIDKMFLNTTEAKACIDYIERMYAGANVEAHTIKNLFITFCTTRGNDSQDLSIRRAQAYMSQLDSFIA